MNARPLPLIVLALSLAACGAHGRTRNAVSSSQTTGAASASASISRTQAASEYVKDVTPINALAIHLQSEIGSGSSSAQIHRAGAPYVTAIVALNPKLRRLAARYPPVARDVAALITEDKRELRDLQGSAPITPSAFVTQFDRVGQAADTLRAALGVTTSSNG